MIRPIMLLFAIALGACTPKVEAVTADAIAGAANVAAEAISDAERAAGLAAIERSDSREEAVERLEGVSARYMPAWVALDALTAVHEAWRRMLVRGDEVPARLRAAALAAWCALRDVAGRYGVKVPSVGLCT